MKSVWEQTGEHRDFAPLKGDISTDVLIIGGGMAGILCAYLLHGAGVPYVLTEAETVCGGITKNTTAKITIQHGLIYDKLLRRFGIGRAGQYLCAQKAALQKYRELCSGMDCDFEEKDAYVYALEEQRKLEQELSAMERLGFHGDFVEHLPLPFPVAGAVRVHNQAQFHPLKFVCCLAKGLHIYEHTPVRELIGTTAVTDSGKVAAKAVIVATHFPFLNKHGSYFLKLYQHRSYVIALENAPDVDGMYVDEAQEGMSFRNARDLLLVGGGGHRTGKRGGAWRELREFARRYEAMNVCLREQAQAAAEALLEQGMKLDGYLAWAAERGKSLDNRAREILEALKVQQSQAQEPPDDVVPTEAQHNEFGGERSSGDMSKHCPQGEAKGMEREMTMGGMSL